MSWLAGGSLADISLGGVWLNTFGDRFSLFSASFFIRNFARIVTVFVVLFAALPMEPKSDGPDPLNPDHLVTVPDAADILARWVQPSTAAAAPRNRKRARNARAQDKKADVASETSPEQPAPVLAPLTPYIQIWPQAHAAIKNDAPAMTQMPAQNLMHVAEKSDRLDAPSSVDVANVIQADELSELDRAAAPALELQPDGLVEPRAQPVALATTDGRAARDTGNSAVPANRFSAFAESVKAIPQAPWFDSVLIVMAGVITAFFAARFFMRA